jgi:hypothetical protein
MNHLACTAESTSRPRAGAHILGRHGSHHLAAFLFVAGAAALAACQFDPGKLTPGDPDRPDADPDTPDASPFDAGAPDATACVWSYVPRYVEPCAAGKPPQDFDVFLPPFVPLVYDTTTGELTGLEISDGLTTDEAGVHTLWVRDFIVPTGVTLRVKGDAPLMIVASGTITVNGVIDASSVRVTAPEAFDRGPGVEPPECSSTAPEAGGECDHGGAGGGGGGFGGAGGLGGDGGGRRGCGSTLSSPGGAGGKAVSVPDKIRAGCAGERGGIGDQDNAYGDGGAGGGAVHLVARVRIDVGGTIHAGGAGGYAGEDRRSGGGGGGSGGFIGLEAPAIVLGADAVLAANGGGGGGGTDGPDEASSGTDAVAVDGPAAGGTGYVTSIGDAGGGEGSALDDLTGGDGGEGDRGGGGGGGGAGYILFYESSPALTGTPIISPKPTQL